MHAYRFLKEQVRLMDTGIEIDRLFKDCSFKQEILLSGTKKSAPVSGRTNDQLLKIRSRTHFSDL